MLHSKGDTMPILAGKGCGNGAHKVLSYGRMDWLTFRKGDEARSDRAAPPSVTEILPELLIGEYPRPEDVAWLKEAHGVTAVMNLQDDDDLKIKGLDAAALSAAYQGHGLTIVRIPVPDASADHVARVLDSAVAQLNGLIESGARVYLHCNAGINRAPTVAIAFMHVYRAMALAEAVTYVRKRRSCAPFTVMLEEFFAARARGTRD
jgi:protein-tyrosine phosphatase